MRATLSELNDSELPWLSCKPGIVSWLADPTGCVPSDNWLVLFPCPGFLRLAAPENRARYRSLPRARRGTMGGTSIGGGTGMATGSSAVRGRKLLTQGASRDTTSLPLGTRWSASWPSFRQSHPRNHRSIRCSAGADPRGEDCSGCGPCAGSAAGKRHLAGDRVIERAAQGVNVAGRCKLVGRGDLLGHQ